MQKLIYKAAGKNAKAIWGIDEAEGDYLVWLKNGYMQRGYNATSFCLNENDSIEDIKYQFSIVEKTPNAATDIN